LEIITAPLWTSELVLAEACYNLGQNTPAVRLLLTHVPQARRQYYGARALARLQELVEVSLHDVEEPLGPDRLMAAARHVDLIIADRANHRLQRFTLEGKHIDFVSGVNLPCHFSIYKNGDVVMPDLGARVTLLDKNNQVILHLGEDSSNTWGELRKQPRSELRVVVQRF